MVIPFLSGRRLTRGSRTPLAPGRIIKRDDLSWLPMKHASARDGGISTSAGQF
jgi:hypothetical protein